MQLGEWFGFVAGGIGVYSAVPQALHIRRLGSGYGVSLGYWLILLLANASWFTFGVIISSPSIVISNVIGFTTSAMVVTAIIKRGRWLWPALFAAAAIWVLLFDRLSLNIISGVLIALTFSRTPQILRSIRNLRAGVSTAVSMRSQYISLASITLWEVYSMLGNSPQLILTTSIAMFMTLAVLVLEVATRRRASAVQAIIDVDGSPLIEP